MLIGMLVLLATPLAGYIVWHALGMALSALVRWQARGPIPVGPCTSKVALLYLTCNDFQAEACATLLAQVGITGEVFILDDSTQLAEQQAIDAWARAQDGVMRVVRRADRTGYKGGNINHWLASYGDPTVYPYVLLVDADEQLPPDFTQRLLATLTAGPYVFAQGCHLGTAELDTPFQALLHPQVECEWLHQVPARNLSRTPPMLGHGVLVHTASLQAVGGFPPFVSEDLALTLRWAVQGHAGIIAPHVMGYEAFPRDYCAYWRRRRRWIQADAEVVRKLLRLLWQQCPSWVACLDLSARELRLPLASAYWMLLVLLAVTGLCGARTHVMVAPAAWSLLPLLLVPALPALGSPRLRLTQRIFYLCTMTFVGAATSALHPLASWQGLTGQCAFEPTGSRQPQTGLGSGLWLWWEIGSGVLCIVGGLWAGNWALVAVGCAMGSSPGLRTRWETAALAVGSALFWLLVLSQIYVDISKGGLPIEHLLALVGLAILLL